MVRFRHLLAILRAILLLCLARLGLGPAIAEPLVLGPFDRPQPRFLKAVSGSEPFDPAEILNGSFSTPDQCRNIAHSWWIEWQGRGECIRYYPHGMKPEGNPTVLVFLPGDVMLRNGRGERRVLPAYLARSPDWVMEEMQEWSAQAGRPAVFIARPGTYGSSGDHNQRRQLREIELMNLALDRLKDQYGVRDFLLAGQSGGGQIVAAMLNRRRDIRAAVISSGLVSVARVSSYWEYRRDIPGRFLYEADKFYDPVTEVDSIAQDPAPAIFVVSDPEDRTVPFHSQLHYVRRLRQVGLHPVHVYAQARDRSRHALTYHGRLAAALLSQGLDEAAIRRALLEYELRQDAR